MKKPEKRHWVRLSSACNNRCLFCLDESARLGVMPDYESVIKDLKNGRKGGVRRVVLSGGEPTLHPRFLDIVSAATRMGYRHVQAITNGRRFCYPGFLDACLDAGLREVTFSMHGHTAKLHDRLVGVPGAFTQAVAGLISALKAPELIVSVDIVLNRLNITRFDELLRFFIRLGVREFDLLQVMPFGNAWEHWDLLDYDPSESGALGRALALGADLGIRLWTNRLAAKHLEGFEGLIQSPEKLHDEVRGRMPLFRHFLTRGEPPYCRGERCRFCFMEGFCADLIALRERGAAESRSWPPCLPKSGAAAKVRFIWEGADTDLTKWTRFFIDHRYYVKGGACAGCTHHDACAGAPIELIREKGFSILKPKKTPAGKA